MSSGVICVPISPPNYVSDARKAYFSTTLSVKLGFCNEITGRSQVFAFAEVQLSRKRISAPNVLLQVKTLSSTKKMFYFESSITVKRRSWQENSKVRLLKKKRKCMQWNKSFGLANLNHGTRVNSNTMFRVASISKTVTAIALMQLVDRGLVDLHRDVSDYLGWQLRNPYFPDIPSHPQCISHRGHERYPE